MTEETTPATAPDSSMKTNADGIVLLRDHLIPNLLGKDTPALLYWAGKQLARQLPLEDQPALLTFFALNGFGELSLKKESRKTIVFTLTGDIVSRRLKEDNASFSLEAGFLAQQLQSQSGAYCEAEYSVGPRKKEILFTVLTDPKQSIDD